MTPDHRLLILAGELSGSAARLARELGALGVEVVIVCDRPPANPPADVTVVTVPDEAARAAGYVNASPLIGKSPIAWDKALYLLGGMDFGHVWITEDDVAFAKPAIALALFEKLRNAPADLLAVELADPASDPHWPNWGHADAFELGDRARAFVPLCRLSKAMVDAVAAHVVANGTLAFVETMLPSLARQNGLTAAPMGIATGRLFRFRPDFDAWEVGLRIRDTPERGIAHPVKSDALRLAIMTRENRFSVRSYVVGHVRWLLRHIGWRLGGSRP